MTSLADHTPRLLAAFSVPSGPGNERIALAKVAEAVAGAGLPADRLERLKTAVAEAAMNAIEHGNGNQAEIPVGVEVIRDGGDLVVTITDQGGEKAAAAAAPATNPDLDLKFAGAQSPRGWGLFLIRHMVDAMDVTTSGTEHTVRLVMRAGAGPGSHTTSGQGDHA